MSRKKKTRSRSCKGKAAVHVWVSLSAVVLAVSATIVPAVSGDNAASSVAPQAPSACTDARVLPEIESGG
jgi:hypothetical protein